MAKKDWGILTYSGAYVPDKPIKPKENPDKREYNEDGYQIDLYDVLNDVQQREN